MILELKNLHATLEGKEIINGVNLKINQGETHVIMGPNGSGKTTLTKAIMGHPKVKITDGEILVDGESIIGMPPNKRAKLGIFLQFQNPVEIEGVGYVNFLHTAKESVSGDGVKIKEFMTDVKKGIENLKMESSFIGRPLNYGFSGGEKKKAEILQLLILKPKIAILDEPDSGLDIDAIKVVAEVINSVKLQNTGIMIITHYNRILSYMKPDFVHVFANGKIVKSGGHDLAEKLEREGYEAFVNTKQEG